MYVSIIMFRLLLRGTLRVLFCYLSFFGPSVGSFFDFQPTEGAYEANPPFVRDVIVKMANHMDTLLQVCTVHDTR